MGIYAAKFATIEFSQLSQHFYLSLSNGCRSRAEFKTIKGAERHAAHHGVTITGRVNPNAVSCAAAVSVENPEVANRDLVRVSITHESGAITRGSVAQLNPVLKDMGYKPIRVTRNILNPDSNWFVIDADTPACCDPGTETYHSM